MNGKELFTGERFIPGIDDDKLEMEHYQRYLSVRDLIRGKVVLDAACGEGYGSSLMAAVAQQVTGLDIDGETVERAQVSYAGQANLCFLQGSIAAIPLEDESVDVVVSFETIEHVPELLQFQFLNEIGRVLKRDGILIMSTPNKEIYSDLYNYKNEFHVKEFYHDEFQAFLKLKFKYVKLFNQAFQIALIMTDCEGKEGPLNCYLRRPGYDQNGKYYIAIASNVPLEEDHFASVYLGDSGEYDRTIQRILTLQQEEEARNEHIRKLNEEAEAARESISRLQAENEERNTHIGRLDAQIDEKNREAAQARETIQKLQEESEERNIHIRYLDGQITEKDQAAAQVGEVISRLQEESRERDAHIRQMDVRIEEKGRIIAEKEQTIAEKDGTIETQRNEIDNLQSENRELRQIVLNKEGHIELLLEVERAYEWEKTTRSYKFGKWLRRVGEFFLPLNSRRRFFARVLADLLKKPNLMLHIISPKRIRNYFWCMKNGGMDSVKQHYRETLKNEEYLADPSGDLKLEEVEQRSAEKAAKSALEYERLVLIRWEKPLVSIVIPVYNQFEYTYNCVKSIIRNSGDVTYEVIIANDCSTDVTKEIEKIVENVRLITTEQNVRFLLNCNNAAKHARGKYILFLNNDTQVQENWLQPLVRLIESADDIGMVGSKLIYPDGFLQEAGGIVWKDASAWNYGNRRNTEDPEFNYVKEADYISGAAIMIRRSLWEEIGGFDERFVPAYYEDTDLAFEVRKHGYRVMYQPLSRVVHFEGISNGTDVQNGLKHYQQVNFQKFYEKWHDVLEAEHEVNAENVFTAKDRSGRKKHMLVVDHYVPHHDQDAGGKCTFMYLQTFVKMGFQVTFIGDNFYKHEPYTTELNQMGIEVLYGNYYYNNWQQWLKENSHYFDYIYLQRPHISIKYIDLVKKYSRAKIFYFAHDLHHIREYREYEMTGDQEKLESSKKWKKIEYELFEKADVGHVVGSFEQQKMQEAFPDKPIRNIPLYIYEDIPKDINKDFASRHDLLYVGGFGHPPNVDAVLWFAKEVFPKVLERYPDMKWHVVGGKATLEVQALASHNIIIEGFLPDDALEKLYRECRMAVVPLRYGAGVKGKVVESAYYQIPLVTTSIGAEGLSRDEVFMVVEDEGEKLAEAICGLYEDYPRLREMSDEGVRFIENHFTLAEAERVLRLDVVI
ncbi:MAG TPA: glycosyl transferase family 2 [Lachnospiraceae bacterium]|nr:glycosyl transferase family 2 [Lachnospiraceae bacterium]